MRQLGPRPPSPSGRNQIPQMAGQEAGRSHIGAPIGLAGCRLEWKGGQEWEKSHGWQGSEGRSGAPKKHLAVANIRSKEGARERNRSRRQIITPETTEGELICE